MSSFDYGMGSGAFKRMMVLDGLSRRDVTEKEARLYVSDAINLSLDIDSGASGSSLLGYLMREIQLRKTKGLLSDDINWYLLFVEELGKRVLRSYVNKSHWDFNVEVFRICNPIFSMIGVADIDSLVLVELYIREMCNVLRLVLTGYDGLSLLPILQMANRLAVSIENKKSELQNSTSIEMRVSGINYSRLMKMGRKTYDFCNMMWKDIEDYLGIPFGCVVDMSDIIDMNYKGKDDTVGGVSEGLLKGYKVSEGTDLTIISNINCCTDRRYI